MAIPNHQITDLKSFQTATTKQYAVAGLYFFSKLDCLVDLARRVSHDFFDRPELFTKLDKVAPLLARLNARSGNDETFLDTKQRQAIYSALFGMPMGMDPYAPDEGSFPNLRDELLEACSTFVETKFGDAPSLRENVRQKHRLFKSYLTGLAGDSVTWSRDGALAGLTEGIAYAIFRSGGVSAVYGIATSADPAWPYSFDSNADKLVEAISKHMMEPHRHDGGQKTQPAPMPAYVSRERITNLQRAALEGAKAIATAVDVDAASPDSDIDLLIQKCYTWGTALGNLAISPRMGPPAVVAPPRDGRGGISVAQPLALEPAAGQ